MKRHSLRAELWNVLGRVQGRKNKIQKLSLRLKAGVSEEILNWHCHSLSLSPDLCIHFYWLSRLRQASHRKMIQSSALRLRLWRFKILTCPLLKLDIHHLQHWVNKNLLYQTNNCANCSIVLWCYYCILRNINHVLFLCWVCNHSKYTL